MAEPKRYYWLKLKNDFFDDDAIDWLEEQEHGAEYVLFYLKLCLKSLKDTGVLIRTVGEMLIPYDVKKLAEITRVKFDTAVVAMELLKKVGLVEILETGEIFMKQVPLLIGTESTSAERVRKSREKKQRVPQCNIDVTHEASQCNSNVTHETLQCNSDVTHEMLQCNIEIDREIELEKEKELETEKDNLSFYLARCEDFSTSQQSLNKPMLKDVQAYAEAENIQTDVQRFYNYYEEHGWKDKKGRDVASRWKATLKRWGEQEGKYPEKRNPNDSHVDAEKSAAYKSLVYNPPDK